MQGRARAASAKPCRAAAATRVLRRASAARISVCPTVVISGTGTSRRLCPPVWAHCSALHAGAAADRQSMRPGHVTCVLAWLGLQPCRTRLKTPCRNPGGRAGGHGRARAGPGGVRARAADVRGGHMEGPPGPGGAPGAWAPRRVDDRVRAGAQGGPRVGRGRAAAGHGRARPARRDPAQAAAALTPCAAPQGRLAVYVLSLLMWTFFCAASSLVHGAWPAPSVCLYSVTTA